MELMPLRPFRSLSSLQGEVNRLFDEFWGHRRGGEIEEFITPAVDVEESDKEISVKAEIPGIDPQEIEVSISGNNLIIKGERKQEREEKKKNYHVRECSYGSFYRSIPLPVEVETDQVSADYKKGILHITLPKSQKVLPKQIKIEVK
jgi:HSP20 family protein